MVILDAIYGVFSVAYQFIPLLDYPIELFSRSGSFGTYRGNRCWVENDPTVKLHDHNMIIYYDKMRANQVMPLGQHPLHMRW